MDPSSRKSNKSNMPIHEQYIDTTCLEGTELKVYELNKKYQREKAIRFKNQILTFSICYLYWVSVHCFREFWSFSKKSIVDKGNTDFDKAILGKFDSAYSLTYSIFGFLSGWISDRYSKRSILAISFGVQALCFVGLFLLGHGQIWTKAYYYMIFFTIGIVQSFVFPILVSTIGMWFSKQYRGLIGGSWATSTNIGNIVGLQLAGLILDKSDGDWDVLMLILAAWFLLNVLLVLVTYKADPSFDNITINLSTEIE